MYKVLTCPACKVTAGVVICETAEGGEVGDAFECGHCAHIFTERQSLSPDASVHAAGTGLQVIHSSEQHILSLDVRVRPAPEPVLDDPVNKFSFLSRLGELRHKLWPGSAGHGDASSRQHLLAAPVKSQPEPGCRLEDPIAGSPAFEAKRQEVESQPEVQPKDEAIETVALSDVPQTNFSQETGIAVQPVLDLLPSKQPSSSQGSPVIYMEGMSFMNNNASGSLVRWRAMSLLLLPAFLAAMAYAVWADSRRLATIPSVSNLVQAYCILTGCDTRPVLDPHPMAITTSTFTENADGQYSFGFSLLNGAKQHLAVPNVQIYFVDSKDKVVMTKLVASQQILPGRDVLLAGQTVAVLFDLALPEQVKPLVAGYRLAVTDASGLPLTQ